MWLWSHSERQYYNWSDVGAQKVSEENGKILLLLISSLFTGETSLSFHSVLTNENWSCFQYICKGMKVSTVWLLRSVIIKPNGKMLVQSLSTHLNSVNRGEKFKCPECDYEATHRSNLATHLKAVHMGQKFRCPKCEYEATWKKSLVTHLNYVLGGEMFKCSKHDYEVNGEK